MELSFNMIDNFKDFSVHHNNGFQIRFGDILVSMVCHSELDALYDMKRENNGYVGSKIAKEYKKGQHYSRASEVDAITWDSHNSEVAVIDLSSGRMITSAFFPDGDGGSIAQFLTAEDFLRLLNEVKEYSDQSKNHNQ